MNSTFKAIIAVIVCIWVFFMGFEIGNFRETRKNSVEQTETVLQSQVQSQAAVETTVKASEQQTTQMQTATQTQANVTSTENKAESTSAQNDVTTGAATESTEMILQELSEAVNNTKNYSGEFTAAFNQTKNLSIVDCSVQSITSTVDKIVKEFIGDGDEFNYSFNNGTGTDKDGNSVTPKDVIPPRIGEKVFSIDEGGVSSAEMTAEGTDKVYRVSVIEEKGDLQTLPVYNSTCAGALDLSDLSIITSADYTYSGTVIEATVNENGLLTAFHVYMPVTATGNGKVLGISGYATFDGNLDENWSFIYA